MRVWLLLFITTSLDAYTVDGAVTEEQVAKASVDTALAGLGQIPAVGPFIQIIGPLANLTLGSGQDNNDIKIIQDGFRQISLQLTESVNSQKHAIGTILVEKIEVEAHALMNSLSDIFEATTVFSKEHAINAFLTHCEAYPPYGFILEMNYLWNEALKLALDGRPYPSKKEFSMTKTKLSNILTQLTIVVLSQQFFYWDDRKEQRHKNIEKLELKLNEIRNNEELFINRYIDNNDRMNYWEGDVMKDIVEKAMTGHKHQLQQVKANVMRSWMSDVYIPPKGIICTLTLPHNSRSREDQKRNVARGGEQYYYDDCYGLIILGGTMKGGDRPLEDTTYAAEYLDRRLGGALLPYECKDYSWRENDNLARRSGIHFVMESYGFNEDSIFECEGDGLMLNMSSSCYTDFFKLHRVDFKYHAIPIRP